MSWETLFNETGMIEKKTNFEPLPKGIYAATITDSKLDENNAQVTLEFQIVAGKYSKKAIDFQASPYCNRKVFKNYSLDKEIGVGVLKADMFTLGAKADNAKNLPDQLSSFVGKTLEVFINQKVSKKDPEKVFNNVYISREMDEKELSNVSQSGQDMAFGDLDNNAIDERPANFNADEKFPYF